MPPNPAIVASAAATVPPPTRILGTALQPFCLGHHLLFKRLCLPFSGNASADCATDEILIGIALCAGPSYETTLGLLLTDYWQPVYDRWLAQLRGPWWHRRALDLVRAEVAFREYLTDGYAQPPLWKHASPHALQMTAPWECLLKVRLLNAGLSEPEILNGYLPGRWYDYYTAVEIEHAAACADVKSWKRLFYTAEHHAQIEAVKSRAAARQMARQTTADS